CLCDYRGVLVPAVSDKVIRDAANDILPVTPDIPFAVVVRIDRIRAEAARHELWRAHGAGIRTGRIGRVHTFLAYEQQEFLEFPCEEFGARRIVESQSRERIEHAVFPGDSAE